MKIINKYIIKNLVLATLVIILLVAALDSCISFVVEQGDVGKGNYTTLDAFLYAVCNIPAHISIGFPIICLVGIVMGFSLLNHNSEMIVIRTNGYSLFKITSIAVSVAFIMSLLVLSISEWVVPAGRQAAEINKAVAKSGGEALKSKYGFWLRAAGDFIHINKILYDGELQDITRYKVVNDELLSVTYAKRAQYLNHQKNWMAYDVSTSILDNDNNKDNNIETKSITQEEWQDFLNPDFLKVVTVLPEDLSITGLYQYIKYRKSNGLYAKQYELALMQKVMQPFTIVVMIFLAVPLVFAQMRSTAVSKRLVLSIMVGISYFLIDKVVLSLIQFFDMPILMSALGPVLCFIVIIIWYILYNKRLKV